MSGLVSWKMLAASLALTGSAVMVGQTVASGALIAASSPDGAAPSATATPTTPAVRGASWTSAAEQYRQDAAVRAVDGDLLVAGSRFAELNYLSGGHVVRMVWVPKSAPRRTAEATGKPLPRPVAPTGHARSTDDGLDSFLDEILPTIPTIPVPTVTPTVPVPTEGPTIPVPTDPAPTTPTPTTPPVGGQGGPRTGPTSAPAPMTGSLDVRMTQANIYAGLAPAAWMGDYQRVLATKPDFITLNEAARRSNTELAVQGYAIYRSDKSNITRETPVLWRTDRWTSIATGTEFLTTKKVKWGVRAINWVTLRSLTNGQVVSVISAHPAPTRKFTAGLLQEFSQKLATRANVLGAKGPVFVGGDLNSHYQTPTWPGAILAGGGLQATYDTLGRPASGTGDYGATIDYVLYQPGKGVKANRGGNVELASDHDALWADFTLPAR